MSIFENTKKAFSAGDNFDNTDDNYTDEKKGVKKFFSDLFGFDKDDEYMDSYDEREDNTEYKEEHRSSRTPSRFSHSGDDYSGRSYSGGGIGTTAEIITMYPQNVDDATKIIREVKLNKIVIFDVNDQIESSEEARRIVDFVGGAAEGLECPFNRLCASIFCIAPKGVKFTNTKTRYTK